MVGFPIRTSALRGLVDGSTQLFAVTHVLHRFLAPRHSPLALISLEKQVISFIESDPKIALEKMLVLALQFSRCDVTLAEHGGSRLDAAASLRNDSLKTEEKTVPIGSRCNRRDRIPQPVPG